MEGVQRTVTIFKLPYKARYEGVKRKSEMADYSIRYAIYVLEKEGVHGKMPDRMLGSIHTTLSTF